MRPSLAPRLFLLTAAALLAAAAPLRAAQFHEDARLGFRIRVPKDWQQMPLQASEGWVVANYLCRDSDFWTDPSLGWTFEHKPTMKMIAFVQRPEEEEVDTPAEAESNKEEQSELILRVRSPFKDYQEYMRGTYAGGGFYVEDETDAAVGGVPVTQLGIRVEKSSNDGPKRIVTWIYHLEGVDLAVQFEVLQDSYSKKKGLIESCLKSLKPIPRVAGGLEEVGSRHDGEIVFSMRDADTPAKRAELKQKWEREFHDKVSQGLPPDWKVERVGRFLVLNHADPKHARRVVDQGEAVFKWLESELSYVGPGEYVRSPVIRICRDLEEERQFWQGTSWWGVTSLEIPTHKSDMGATSYEYEYLNKRLLWIWLNDRDIDVASAMPRWFSFGLGHVLGTASAKGGKLEFKPDQRELQFLRETRRQGANLPVEGIFMIQGEDLDDNQVLSQAAAMVRYLIVGPGAKVKPTRGLAELYLGNLKEVVQQIEDEEKKAREAAEGKEGGKAEGVKPKTEEEEEEYYREQQNKWKERERRVLEDTFKRTFGSWSDRDWKALENGFFKEIG